MFARFAEACRLLKENFWLFAAIILTVMLPGNILSNYISYYVGGANEQLNSSLVTLLIAIFEPIYIGALFHSLFQIKSGRKVSFRDAMTIGFNKWEALLVAQFVAGIFISLGFIALIIPGLVLAVRYSFLDAVVIIENNGAKEARVRSTELTTGYGWQIFWTLLVSSIPFFVLGVSFSLIESLHIMFVEVLFDSILNIAGSVIYIVLFLFYWESVQAQKSAEPVADEDELPLVVQPAPYPSSSTDIPRSVNNYRPAGATSIASEDIQNYKAAIGKNFEVYADVVNHVRFNEGTIKSGHWPALFCGMFWALYRKMYLIGFSYLLFIIAIRVVFRYFFDFKLLVSVIQLAVALFFSEYAKYYYVKRIKHIIVLNSHLPQPELTRKLTQEFGTNIWGPIIGIVMLVVGLYLCLPYLSLKG